MKKTSEGPLKKLSLSKETVRVLTTTQLKVVSGGDGCAATTSTNSRRGEDGAANPTTC